MAACSALSTNSIHLFKFRRNLTVIKYASSHSYSHWRRRAPVNQHEITSEISPSSAVAWGNQTALQPPRSVESSPRAEFAASHVPRMSGLPSVISPRI